MDPTPLPVWRRPESTAKALLTVALLLLLLALFKYLEGRRLRARMAQPASDSVPESTPSS